MKKSPAGFMLVFVLPMILGLIVVSLWINVIFLGLFGGSVKEQIKAAADQKEAMQKAMADKKEAMGPWSIHSILVLVLIIFTLLLFVTRRPLFFMGWDDQIHLANCGASMPIILICVVSFAVPANYVFCRYYVCRQPEKPGTTPSLVGWKAVNSNTPWAQIFMLAAGHGFAVGLRDSKLLQLIQETFVRQSPGVGNCFIIGTALGTLFSIMAPGTALARITLLSMFKTVSDSCF